MDYINALNAKYQSELAFGNALSPFPERFTSDYSKNKSTTIDAFIGITNQISKEGVLHIQIANGINDHVIVPFTNWAISHKQRVEYSETELKAKLKAYQKASLQVDKFRSKYFNKVRSAEEFKEKLESKITEQIQEESSLIVNPSTIPTVSPSIIPPTDFSAPDDTVIKTVSDAEPNVTTLKRSNTTVIEDMKNLTVTDEKQSQKLEKENDQDIVFILADVEYSKSQVTELLNSLLNQVKTFSHKITILGTYDHVSTGASITEGIQKNTGISSLEKLETFGQDLIDYGFIRSVGVVSNQFANSSRMYYQWKPEAFKLAKLPFDEPESSISMGGNRNSVLGATFYNGEFNGASKFTEVFEDVKGMITTLEPNEENYKKVLREVQKSEQEYLESTKILDNLRMDLEENIENHFNFMERCELDRLKALKKVTIDYLTIVNGKLDVVKEINKNSLDIQSEMNPELDLQKMITNNKTGPFMPQLKIFEDYFDSQDTQVFGVSLQTRCRYDHKSVPLILSTILMHLDSVYPDMKDDEERMGTWLNTVPLSRVHELRIVFNDPKFQITGEVLCRYKPSELVSLLRLYLLELPDSLVPNEKYYLIKSLYEQYGSSDTNKEKIIGIENLLADLPRPNIATLNYICAHLGNFISIISVGKSTETEKDKVNSEPLTNAQLFKLKISQLYGDAILRNKAQYSVLVGEDQHSSRLLDDLITHKDEIFKELRNRNKSTSRMGSKKSKRSISSASGVNSLVPVASATVAANPADLFGATSKSIPTVAVIPEVSEIHHASSGKKATDLEPDTVIET